MPRSTYKWAPLPASKFAEFLERPDFHPTHPERKHWMEDRRKKRKKTAHWLLRKYRHDTTALAIADQLESCSDHNPCRSCACPACYQAMANRFTNLAAQFLSKQCPGDMSLYTITIVPNFGVLKRLLLNRRPQ